MSSQSDKAREHLAAGKPKAALDRLRYAMPTALAGDLDEAKGITELLREISRVGDRRMQEECDDMLQSLQDVITRESGPARDLEQISFAFLRGCRLIACAGIAAEPSATGDWCLAFTEDRVALVPPVAMAASDVVDIGWHGLAVEIEGAGMVTSGGGFIDGGFGLEGAAVGMLTAAALNALTTSSHMDTVVHLQTSSAEVYLLYGQLDPVSLRRVLSSVFLRLRQAAGGEPPASGSDHVVDRLHKLAGLLDKGLIDEGEFARLKADLMRSVT